MSAACGVKNLIVELDKSRKEEHLRLAPSRNGIPRLKSLRWNGGKFNAVCELSREAHAGTDGPPSNESGHGDASVLDLGMAVPGDGLVGAHLSEA
jgi:hypothetical protein